MVKFLFPEGSCSPGCAGVMSLKALSVRPVRPRVEVRINNKLIMALFHMFPVSFIYCS